MTIQSTPEAPGKEKVAAGHYQSSDADGRVYDIIHNRRYGDWDVRGDDDRVLYAREATLDDALDEMAGWSSWV